MLFLRANTLRKHEEQLKKGKNIKVILVPKYMTDKELKKLSRSELLELLISQIEENDSLVQEIESLKDELNQRLIIKQKAGSIAEAAVGINKIFEAADFAAKQYIESVRHMADKGELEYEEKNGENISE